MTVIMNPDYTGLKYTGFGSSYTKPKPFSMLTDAEKRLRILGTPIMTTGVYHPTPADLERMRQKGIVRPIQKIVEKKMSNGDTVKVAVDPNGKVVDVEKKMPDWAPLAITAAIAFAVLGG